MRLRPVALLFASLFSSLGCGSNLAPVSGTIQLDGKSLPGAMVVFQPISTQTNPGPASQGKTDAQGRYVLELMIGDRPGAIIGSHRVVITAYEGDGGPVSSGPDMAFRKALVPKMYNSESKLTFDVPAGGTDRADFELASSPRK